MENIVEDAQTKTEKYQAKKKLGMIKVCIINQFVVIIFSVLLYFNYWWNYAQ